LVNLEVVALEGYGRSRHVQSPNASAFKPNFFNGLVEALHKIAHPVTKSDRVVLAEALEVANFKAVRLEHRHEGSYFVQFAIGKDVAIDERAPVL
jgi:hypothetical protein